MKIAQIVSTFPPYHGGMGNTAYNFSKYLAKLGHDVTVITPTAEKKDNPAEFKIEYLKPLFSFGNAGFLPQLFWRLSDFDIIHLHYPFFGGTEAVLFFKKFKNYKAKLVLQYHMDVVACGFKSCFFKIYNKIVRPQIIKAADFIICSSYDYIEHSEIKKFYQENKSVWKEIPLGVDKDKFKPKSKNADLLKKYKINPNEKAILFVGGLDKPHYFKGVDVLIKAFAKIIKDAALQKLASAKLLIVGEGDLKKEYQKLAYNFGLGDKIIFAGNVSDQDLSCHYNLADVVVLPSIDKSEAFGLVLIEAMACAKPIIASDLPGVRTLIQNEINGFLVKPKSSDDLAEKLVKILSAEDKIISLGQAGRKKIEEIYDWEKVGQKLEEAYLRLL